jgi:hypothetical protein
MSTFHYIGLLPFRNLGDIRNPAAAATNLGLGTGNSPTFTGLSGTSTVEVQGNKNVANGYPGLDSSGDLVSSIVLLHDVSSNGTFMSFIPMLGQPAWVSDTKTLVIGDGTTAVSALPPITFGSVPGYGTPSVAITNGNATGNAGTGASISVTGTDAGFSVTLNTGSAGVTVNQTMFTVTFGETYGFIPVYTMSPANTFAVALSTTKTLFVRQDTAGYNSVSIWSGISALSVNATYVWNFTLGY